MTDSHAAARVAALHVYPVKGCRGLAADEADLRVTGLVLGGVGDREWMVVDPSGRFLTQREHPALARVAVQADDGALALGAPGRPAIAVGRPATDPIDVVVWGSEVRGFDAGDAAAAWFTTLLGTPARLVRFDPVVPRACNPEYAGDSGAHTLFADGYPLLVIGRASLDDLNARLAAKGVGPLPMNRFRPNLVLDGLSPYDEDHLDTIETPGATLRLVKPCARCVVTTTDQDSGARAAEPLVTLAGYRLDERLGGVTFGMNAIVIRPGQLRVGEAARGRWRF